MSEADPVAINVRLCFQCGTCNASCPIHRLTDEFNPVRISRTVLVGSKRELLENRAIWLCAKCYFCTERCPRDVNFSDVIVYLQNLASSEGKALPQFKEAAKNVLETGWSYKLGFGQTGRSCRTGAGETRTPSITESQRESCSKTDGTAGLYKDA